MSIIKYPGINKKDLIENYADRLLKCMKEGMRSSYDIVINPEGDSSWYKYLHINLDKGVRYIVIEDKAVIRGYLVWHDHGDEVHIYDLVISPGHQKDGSTLRKLLRIFASDVSSSDFKDLVAYTNYKNDRMNRLLLRHGFAIRQKRARGTVYVIDIDRFIKKFS